MAALLPSAGVRRFGAYEVDLRARELRKHGLKIKLQEKPFQILMLLLERAGDVVTRDELREKLWPSDTFVDFDHSLNAAVNKLREALSDSAGNPRFVETLARRGYRFIAPVEGSAGSRSRRRRATRPIESLAVLPFENAAGDPDTDYLADGITESILASFSPWPQLRVMSQSAVSRFKGRAIDPQQAGRELNVGAVLTGRLTARENAVTITAELVDVSTGWRLWGHRYQQKVSDLLALQEEIAHEVCEKLRLKLSGKKKREPRRQTESAEAYQAYLQGRYHGKQSTEDALKKGIECFQKAIETDPDYALAYAGLAECYSVLGVFGLLPPREVLPRLRKAAARALEVDRLLAEAHTSLAVAGLFYDWDWGGAEGEFRQAMDLNPHYAAAHFWFGLFCLARGRFEQALAAIQRAQQLDPFSLLVHAAGGLPFYFERQFAKAAEKYQQTIEARPQHPLAYCFLGLAQEQMGKVDDAAGAFQKAVHLSGGAPPAVAMLGHLYALMGNHRQAQELLERLTEVSAQRYAPPVRIALIHAALRDKDRAFEWLEKAYQDRSTWLLFLEVDPIFDPLRADARFQDLARRVGIAPSAALATRE